MGRNPFGNFKKVLNHASFVRPNSAIDSQSSAPASTPHSVNAKISSKDGALLGLLNIWDILLKALPPYIISGDLPDVRFAPDLNQLHERLAALRTQAAADLIDRNPPQAKPGDSVLECAALMLHAPHRVHLLPVVDESGRLLGVIAPWDLIKEIG
jgi:CBS domain-containing protein